MADELFAFASESSSLIRDGLFTKDQVDAVPRGSYIAVLPDGEVEVKPFSDPVENEAACHFEWTYFLKRASIFKELAAHRLRYKLGVALAEQEQLWFEKNTIIVPVPYTAKDAARGYSERFGGPRIAEAMDRERGSSRTFITGRHDRLDRIKEKYLFVPDLIEGRPVVVIDDSIVRGATLEYIGRGLKNAGATEVHFKSTCPPITHPCPYAINFHTEKELFTNREDKNLPEGIDTLTYLSLENYKRAFEQLRVNPNSLCTGCLTGKYPHDV
jgi:amidophosphoribosyltransferase